MKNVFFKISLCAILVVIMFVLPSCSNTADNAETTPAETSTTATEETKRPSVDELYGKAVVDFEGKLIDIPPLEKRHAIEGSYAFFPQSFAELDDYIRSQKNGCILKVKVTDITVQKMPGESFRMIYVPMVIDEILYQSENINLFKGQELTLNSDMYVVEQNSKEEPPKLYLHNTKGCVFFVGGEYFLVGYYHTEENQIQPCISYSGVIEITSFNDANGFGNDPLGFKEEAFAKYGITPK